jgi:hypothetical protein
MNQQLKDCKSIVKDCEKIIQLLNKIHKIDNKTIESKDSAIESLEDRNNRLVLMNRKLNKIIEQYEESDLVKEVHQYNRTIKYLSQRVSAWRYMLDSGYYVKSKKYQKEVKKLNEREEQFREFIRREKPDRPIYEKGRLLR